VHPVHAQQIGQLETIYLIILVWIFGDPGIALGM
jgi:hypothetical protein